MKRYILFLMSVLAVLAFSGSYLTAGGPAGCITDVTDDNEKLLAKNCDATLTGYECQGMGGQAVKKSCAASGYATVCKFTSKTWDPGSPNITMMVKSKTDCAKIKAVYDGK